MKQNDQAPKRKNKLERIFGDDYLRISREADKLSKRPAGASRNNGGRKTPKKK